MLGIPLGSSVLLVECLAELFLLRGKELAIRLPLHKMSAVRLPLQKMSAVRLPLHKMSAVRFLYSMSFALHSIP